MLFYFIICFLIPITMIILGIRWRKNPPKSMNYFYGFRTKRSMKNKDTWRFAHLHQSKLLLVSGILTIIVLLFLMFILKEQFVKYVVFIIMAEILLQIMLIPITENKLKRTFNKSGKRIDKSNKKYSKKE